MAREFEFPMAGLLPSGWNTRKAIVLGSLLPSVAAPAQGYVDSLSSPLGGWIPAERLCYGSAARDSLFHNETKQSAEKLCLVLDVREEKQKVKHTYLLSHVDLYIGQKSRDMTWVLSDFNNQLPSTSATSNKSAQPLRLHLWLLLIRTS